MDLRQVICPHQPSETRGGIDRPQRAQAVAGKPCVQLGFRIGDDYARMVDQAFRMCQPLIQRRRSLRSFRGLAGLTSHQI